MCVIHKKCDFHLWVMCIVCIKRDPSGIFSPRWRHQAARHALLSFTSILRWQWINNGNKQALPPALIWLAHPSLLSPTTPHWFHLHSIYMKAPPPPSPPPFSTRTDKNDKWPTPSSLFPYLPLPHVGCPRLYKPIFYPQKSNRVCLPFFPLSLKCSFCRCAGCSPPLQQFPHINMSLGIISTLQDAHIRDVRASRKTNEGN